MTVATNTLTIKLVDDNCTQLISVAETAKISILSQEERRNSEVTLPDKCIGDKHL